jgi:uncharacterized metal-binding protein
MIAWPALEALGAASPAKVADEIAVRIEKANGGNVNLLNLLLPSRLPYECGRQEHRRGRCILIVEDRRYGHLCGTRKIQKEGMQS